MGLFSSPFKKLKKRMEEEFVKEYHEGMGFSKLEARSLFKDLFSRAERISKETKTFDYPMNFGDILLEKESTDSAIRASLEKKRKEGVTSADIKWWWNRHDLDRRFVLELLMLHRVTKIRQFLEDEGLDDKEAARRIRQGEADYGDPENTEHTTGDDRPLPYELINRVDSYVARRMSTDPEKFLIEISGSSTFNARRAKASTVETMGAVVEKSIPSHCKRQWQQLLQRVFHVTLTCPHCNTDMKIIAVITESEPIHKILDHLKSKKIDPRAGPFANRAA